MSRIVMNAKFVQVLQIDTEWNSYLIRDKQPIHIVLKDGRSVGGVLIGKNNYENCIVVETHKKIEVVVELDSIHYLA